MRYEERVPHPQLRPYLRCVWRLQGPAAPGPVREVDEVVPDGCPELIVHRADPFVRIEGAGRVRTQASTLLVGQLREAIRIAPTGVVDVIGVRFEPAGLHAFLGVPMHELTDLDLGLEDVSASLRAEIEGAAKRPGDLHSIQPALEQVLSRELERRSPPAGGLAASATHLAMLCPTSSVEALAAELGVGRRSLERLFRTEVGLSPKHFLRIQRLQAVLTRLDRASSPPSWSALASEAGFSDQAHLIRDFRLLAGTTPQRYLRQRHPDMSWWMPGDVSHSSNP